MRLTHIAAALIVLAPQAVAGAYTLKATSDGATLHWRTPAIELSIHESTVARFGALEAREALEVAIAAWSRAEVGPRVEAGPMTTAPAGFVRGSAVNGVYSVSPWPYEAKLLAVTVSSYDTRTGELLDADVLLNGDEAFIAPAGDGHYDLASILTHELGHVLGLGEAEHAPGSAMYPRIGKADLSARTPSRDDFEGLAAIYGEGGAAQLASISPPRFHGFLATSSFLMGFLVLLVGHARSPEARESTRAMRWSPRKQWDEKRLHS